MNLDWLFSYDWLKSINLLTAFIGGAIVWIFAQLKSIRDIQKQTLENTSIRVSLIEKLLAIDKEQRENLEKLDELIPKYLELIKLGFKDDANKVRREIHDHLRRGFIGSYYRYFKLARLIEGKKGAKDLAHSEMLPFLETCVAYITYINHDNVIKKLETHILPFHLSTFAFALIFIKSETSFWSWGIKKRIRRCEKIFNKYKNL